MARVVTVTFNTLLDFVARADLVAGRVNRTPRFEAVAGGKGINVARVLASHGHEVSAVGFAGGWSGEAFRELVEADHVRPILVATGARTRIGFQSVGTPSTSLLEDGFEVSPGEAAELAEQTRRAVSGAALVILGGSVPHRACVDLVRRISATCAGLGVPCWADCYGQAMDLALGSGQPPSLAKPNKSELTPSFERCPEVHLTDGAGPVEVRCPQGRYRVHSPVVEESCPVGSGDCYLAGLAHARLSGWALEEQLRYAAAAGAANAAAGAVARIGPEEISKVLGRVRVEKG